MLEVAGFLAYLPVVVYALHNFWKYVIKQKRYKQKPILYFYILMLLSLLMRSIEFFLLIFYFYCDVLVLNVAQTATIAKLGLGIIHTHILATLYYDLKKLDIQIKNDNSVEQKREGVRQVLRAQKILKVFFIVFFFFTITTQSFISYAAFISIRFEFGLQAVYYFGTLITMIYFTRELIRQIKDLFGNNNSSFDLEI